MTWFREHLQSPKVGEEALVKALRHYPNRQDLRLRLMERYANRKEVESFAQLGREMFLMTRGRNKEWPDDTWSQQRVATSHSTRSCIGIGNGVHGTRISTVL